MIELCHSQDTFFDSQTFKLARQERASFSINFEMHN